MAASATGKVSEQLIKARAGTFDLDSVFSLSLSRLQLTRLDGGAGAINSCVELTELDASANAIDTFAGVDGAALPKLRVLDLSQNRFTKLDSLCDLPALETLYLHANSIGADSGGGALDQALAVLTKRTPALKTLYLRKLDGSAANPVCREFNYRDRVRAAFPKLQVLDGERLQSQGSAIYAWSDALAAANAAAAAASVAAAAKPAADADADADTAAAAAAADDIPLLTTAAALAAPLPSEALVASALAECKRLDAEAGAAVDAFHRTSGAANKAPAAVAAATVSAVMASAVHASSYYTNTPNPAITAATTAGSGGRK